MINSVCANLLKKSEIFCLRFQMSVRKNLSIATPVFLRRKFLREAAELENKALMMRRKLINESSRCEDISCILQLKIFAIVFCNRQRAPKIFEDLQLVNFIVNDIPKRNLSKWEQADPAALAKNHLLQQLENQELHTLGVVLYYFPDLKHAFKTWRSIPRRQSDKRDTNKQHIGN